MPGKGFKKHLHKLLKNSLKIALYTKKPLLIQERFLSVSIPD
jgi:hypothetical protein